MGTKELTTPAAGRFALDRLLSAEQAHWWILPFLLLLLALPFGLSGYWLRVLSYVFVMGALTQSYNLIVGLTGYPAFGHAVFFGMGAYTVGILMNRLELSFWATLPAAALVPAAAALLLGLPLLRLKSSYFSVATIGVMYAVREVVINLRDVTGGSQGLVIPGFFTDPRTMILSFYYILLLLMVLSTFVIWRVQLSRFGYGLAAIRDDEDAARVMGVPTVRYKIAAWSGAAAMAGLAGGLYGGLLGFLEAPNLFNIALASQAFIMMLLGGMGTVTGPILGAFFLQILSELIWGNFAQYNMLVLGAIVVLVTVFMPAGLTDLFGRLIARLRRVGKGEART